MIYAEQTQFCDVIYTIVEVNTQICDFISTMFKEITQDCIKVGIANGENGFQRRKNLIIIIYNIIYLS